MTAPRALTKPAAWPVVVAAGVSAALHVGKLAPAIPVLRDTLGVSLAEAGFLISTVQLAGMVLGMVAGLAADSVGPRRCMLLGLVLLSLASIAGGFAESAAALLALRGLEGFGFLLASMPAPSLIRRLVPRERVSRALGWWGSYVPIATAAALLLGPFVIHGASWHVWWWGLAALSLAMAGWLAMAVPADPTRAGAPAVGDHWRARLVATLRSPGPWLVAASFAMYSGQWLAVVGFLPAIYAQAAVAPGVAGVLTAMVALVNMAGNVGSGRLLARGVPPSRLLLTGFVAMGVATAIAFAPWPVALPPALRYAAVLAFSGVGGLIPGTLFSLAVRLAPSEGAVSTTVGLVHQCSAVGQFLGPPVVGWVAGRAGGWQWTWCVTGACSVLGVLLASRLARRS